MRYEPQFQEGERENGQWYRLFMRFLTQVYAYGHGILFSFYPCGMLDVQETSRY